MSGPSDGREWEKTVNYVGAAIEQIVDFLNPANLFGNFPMFPSTDSQGTPNAATMNLDAIMLSNPLTAAVWQGGKKPAELTRDNPMGAAPVLYIGIPIVLGVCVAVYIMRHK